MYAPFSSFYSQILLLSQRSRPTNLLPPYPVSGVHLPYEKLGEKIDTHHNYPEESTAINSLVNAFDPLRDKALYVMKEEHWLVSRPKPQKKKVTQEKKGISIRFLSNELVQQKIEKVWGLPRLQDP